HIGKWSILHAKAGATRLTAARVEKPWGQGHLDAGADGPTRHKPYSSLMPVAVQSLIFIVAISPPCPEAPWFRWPPHVSQRVLRATSRTSAPGASRCGGHGTFVSTELSDVCQFLSYDDVKSLMPPCE